MTTPTYSYGEGPYGEGYYGGITPPPPPADTSTYTVQRSLNQTNWTTVAEGIPTPGAGVIEDTGYAFNLVNYYRVLAYSTRGDLVHTYYDSVHALAKPPAPAGWRFIAQNIITGEWLAWNLELDSVTVTWMLDGPDMITATLPAAHAEQRGLFEEWQTAVYSERDGTLQPGGIVSHVAADGRGGYSIDVTGFCGYPHGEPYGGKFEKDSIDPLDAVREIWRYLQDRKNPTGYLGLVVDDTTSPVRVGKNPEHVPLLPGSGGDDSGEEKEPYQLLWYETTDCGEEIDELAATTPFDYRETHEWNGVKVRHRLRLYYPRAGRKRDDLRFVLGENIVEDPQPEWTGDDYWNVGVGLGKGEGSEKVRVTVPVDDGRLRRTGVINKPAVEDKDRLRALVGRSVRIHSQMLHLSQVVVYDHPDAPLGSFGPGDDIFVVSDTPGSTIDIWFRVVSYSADPGDGTQVVLNLARSDSFTYGEA